MTTTVSLDGILTFLSSMSLSAQNKRWLGERLIAQAAKEESIVQEHSARVVKVKRHSTHAPSDAELEARFAGQAVPTLPEDPSWSEVISANTGKTIKPIEKWL